MGEPAPWLRVTKQGMHTQEQCPTAHVARARAAVLAWRARGVHSMVAGWPAPLHAWPLPGDPVPYRQAADQSRSRRRGGGPGRPQAGTGGDVRAQGLAGRPTGRGLR